jgi:hypothetical protein
VGLRADGSNGFKYWDYDKDINGPYNTWNYADPQADDPFKLIGKTYRATTAMDAFVYVRPDERHVALIYLEGSDGEDYMIHARNNTDGTVINVMPYRSYPDIKAVWRKTWTPECYPKCPPK